MAQQHSELPLVDSNHQTPRIVAAPRSPDNALRTPVGAGQTVNSHPAAPVSAPALNLAITYLTHLAGGPNVLR